MTSAAFARVDFGKEYSSDFKITGNIGLRYVQTTVQSAGSIQLPTGEFFDNVNIVNGVNVGGNGDGIVSVAELQKACSNVQVGQVAPGYCGLSATRLAEFGAFFTAF